MATIEVLDNETNSLIATWSDDPELIGRVSPKAKPPIIFGDNGDGTSFMHGPCPSLMWIPRQTWLDCLPALPKFLRLLLAKGLSHSR